MRRHLIAVVLLLGVAGLVFYYASLWAWPRVVAQVRGELLAPPTGEGRWVAWLEGDSEAGRLVVTGAARRGARPLPVEGALSGLTVAGEAAFLTRTQKTKGDRARCQLLRVSLLEGDTKVLATLARPADQMVGGDGWLCWREDRPAALPGVPFVAAGAPVTVIRACPQTADQVHTVAVMSGERAAGPGSVELLGIAGGNAYWLEHRGTAVPTTVIRRTMLPQGSPQTIIAEPGSRTAALAEDALLWTSPSQEAAEPNQFSAVKRQPFAASDIQVVGDWLGAGAVSLASPQDAYARDQYHLWRLGGERGEQRRLCRSPANLVNGCVVGDEEYLVVRSRGGLAIAKRPLSWWGRLRSLL